MLYLIKEYGKNNKEYLKIGKADNIDKRIQQYNTNCAEFELIDTFEGSLPEENLLHSLLKKYKTKGEWMEYNEEILLLWKLYKNLRPKIKESILQQEDYVRRSDYLKKLEDMEEKISEISKIYSESMELFEFTFKTIPIDYRKQICNHFNGKLHYFNFKENN